MHVSSTQECSFFHLSVSNCPCTQVFEISPVIGEGVNFANGSYQSIYGELKVSWKKEKEKVACDIEVPVNTKATFVFKDNTEQLEPGKYHFCL